MNILALSEHYPSLRAGTARYVAAMCREWSNQGHDVTLVTTTCKDSANGNGAEGYQIVGLDLPSGMENSRIGRFLLTGKTWYRVGKIVEQVKPDVVHILYGHSIPAAVRTQAGKLPIIWTVHNVPPSEYGLRSYEKGSARDKVQSLYVDVIRRVHGSRLRSFKYDRLICPSDLTRQKAIAAGVSARKTVVIPLGVDVDTFKPVLDSQRAIMRSSLGWTGRKIILTVGGVVRHKRQELVIRALPEVLREWSHAYYVNVGPVRDVRYEEELRNIRREAGMEHRYLSVELRDEDLARYYAAADVYVHPSEEEGFGLAPLEALSVGSWVVGRDVGGIAEYVRKLSGGEIVDGRVATVARAISDAMGRSVSYEDRCRLHRQVRAKYSWDRVARDTLEVYAQVM